MTWVLANCHVFLSITVAVLTIIATSYAICNYRASIKKTNLEIAELERRKK